MEHTLAPDSPVVAFGDGAPRGFSLGAGDETLALVVGGLPPGSTLRSAFGDPEVAAERLLRLTLGAAASGRTTQLLSAREASSRSGTPLYVLEYTVDVGGVGASGQQHVLCALAARRGQLFTLSYRAPARRWADCEEDVRRTVASFDV